MFIQDPIIKNQEKDDPIKGRTHTYLKHPQLVIRNIIQIIRCLISVMNSCSGKMLSVVDKRSIHFISLTHGVIKTIHMTKASHTNSFQSITCPRNYW
jgi:hypothetical protein